MVVDGEMKGCVCCILGMLLLEQGSLNTLEGKMELRTY